MCNLVLGNIRRLVKTRVFQITAAVIAALGLFQIVMIYRDAQMEMGEAYFDSGLFSFAAVGVFALAAVIPLFVGSEYSDGTLRNKIVVGNLRVSVYMSVLITSTVLGWMLILVWTAAYLVPGVILLEHANPLWVYLYLYLAMSLELAVFSAIFTFLTMTLGNKAVSAVVCILCAFLLIMQGIVVKSLLDEPEYYAPEIIVSDAGNIIHSGEPEKNPNYIPEGSSRRAFYNFLMDFTPGGQSLQISAHATENLNKICFYDIGWFVIMAGAGVLVFRRKDLK